MLLRENMRISPTRRRRTVGGAVAAILLSAAAGLSLSSGPAAAQTFCYVSDPTDTPLNIRVEPNGNIVGTIRNGTQVVITETRRDRRGRVWVFIRDIDNDRGIGWVFREYLTC